MAFWEKFWKYQNGALIDALDKKNVGIFGRSAKAFLIKNGLPIINVADPYDILYDPACDPTNIDFSSSYIIRLNIVETVEEVKANSIFFPFLFRFASEPALGRIIPSPASWWPTISPFSTPSAWGRCPFTIWPSWSGPGLFASLFTGRTCCLENI